MKSFHLAVDLHEEEKADEIDAPEDPIDKGTIYLSDEVEHDNEDEEGHETFQSVFEFDCVINLLGVLLPKSFIALHTKLVIFVVIVEHLVDGVEQFHQDQDEPVEVKRLMAVIDRVARLPIWLRILFVYVHPLQQYH